MCNKYEKYSKVDEYEKHNLVQKMNEAMDNFDFKREASLGIHICIRCLHSCKGCSFNNKCLFFEKAFSTKEYRIIIRDKKEDLEKLCKLYGLNHDMLKDMLNNRIPMTEYYAECLNLKLIDDKLNKHLREVAYE